MLRARVYVTYKPGVLEPQGLAVQGILTSLGFDEVTEVRVGKFIEVALDHPAGKELDDRLHAMSEQVLSNPVIENFRVEWLEDV